MPLAAWNAEVREMFLCYIWMLPGQNWSRKREKYNWEEIEKENQLDRWREEGKHIVLRFVCDVPGAEKHMDIPEWLYKKTDQAGTWYDVEFGKGFSPIITRNNLLHITEKLWKRWENIGDRMD